MTSEQYKKVKEIFQAALERQSSERVEFLNQAGNGDKEIIREVESLLQSHDDAGQFIEKSAFEAGARLITGESNASMAGKRLGQYRLMRRIGSGGMGLVYLAERADEQFQKQVAIKIIRVGLDSPETQRRFRYERQILATLDHSNIAKLLDAGVTETGLPYLVMDYVEGVPITEYCEHHGLSANDRLKLFRIVCSAVQFAHQRLVIHRDIKPGNILVTTDGSPKLLDFGIAKLLDPALTEADGKTQTGVRVMTPEYASPEQIRDQEVTTATDVYSLGVLLYELLTGQRPYRVNSRRPDEIARAVKEQEPIKPSQAAFSREKGSMRSGQSSERETSESANDGAADVYRKLPAQAKALRGDLDNIVLMALRKDPERRYASVEQFSDDLRRHLDGLPVIARKDTISYRSVKFVRRHRLGVAAALMVLVALIAGVVATAWQARVAARERDQARLEKLKAERVKDFLQEMLNSSDPQRKGSNVKAADLLADATRRAAELNLQPQLQAELRRTIAETYVGLALYDQAEPLLQTALDTQLRLFGEDHVETARTLYDLATLNRKKGDFRQAEVMFRRTLAIQRKLAPQGDAATAETLFYLGDNMFQAGRTDDAEAVVREAQQMILKVAGARHLVVALAEDTEGLIKEYRGDLSGAEKSYRQSLETFRQLGPQSAIESIVLMNLATNLTSQKRYDEASQIFREVIDLSRKLFGSDHPNEAIVLTHYGRMLFLKGDYAKAEELLRSAVEIERKVWPPGHPDSAQTLATLGTVLTRAAKAKEAESYLREALAIREKGLPKGHWATANVKSMLGECLTVQRRYAEAQQLLDEGYDEIKVALGENHPRTVEALDRLNQFRDATSRSQSR